MGIQADEVISLCSTSNRPVWGGLVSSEAVEERLVVLSFHPQVFCLLCRKLMTQTVESNCSLGPLTGNDWEPEKVVAV